MIDQIRIQTTPPPFLESLVRYSTKLTDQSGPAVTHHLKNNYRKFCPLDKTNDFNKLKQDTNDEEFCRYLISNAMRLHGQFSFF